MALNAHFDQGGGLDSSGFSAEQSLIQNLYTEAIKIYGFDVFYIPRTLVNVDKIFEEDELSKFTSAHSIEMYLQSVDGFEGEGDFLSKFGVEIRDRASFVVVKSRWTEAVDDNASLIIEGRPNEGDLIYFPLTKGLFEISFVEHENIFYQANNIYTYRIDVERFVYSSEKIDTGIAAIDAIEDARSIDALTYELIEENGIMLENGDPLTLENGNRLRNESSGALILENGFKIIKEDYGLSTTTTPATTAASIEPLARNADFGLNADDIIDFSTSNPFGEVQR
tara:strand:- start:640 stop:1485 length:846 start_codon:yes stop_codon:yes gene_type:complete